VGVGFGLSFVAATMLLLGYFGRGVYLELYSIMCLVSTLAALGPALGGWARDIVGGFQGVFLICALTALVMLAASAVMKRPAET
jgi:cyanate permease